MVQLLPQTKVLIIGSGISGLVLAQILRKAQIECEVFERDDGSRAQGWSIGLDQCLEPLYPLLPLDLEKLSSTSPNTILGKDDSFTIFDGPSHQIIGTMTSKGGATVNGKLIQGINANRARVRAVLRDHLKINYSKQFETFEEDQNGITAFFNDGTTARGDILVGADGSGSRVRYHLLPGFQASHSGYITFHGDVLLSKDEYAPLLEHSTCGLLGGGPGVKMFIVLSEFLEDMSAWFNWSVSWRPDNLEEDQAWAETASQESLLEKTLQAIHNYPEYIVQSIRKTLTSNVRKPPIKLIETLLPPQGLPKGRVTLLGDAAHSMVPFRGMGANTAIIGACDLGRGLIQGIKAKEDLQWVLQSYEKTMIPRGRAKVLESQATGGSEDLSQVAGGRPIVP